MGYTNGSVMVINTTLNMMDLAQAAKDRNIKLVRRHLANGKQLSANVLSYVQ